MFRTLATAVLVAALTAPSAVASYRGDSGSGQAISRSTASVCDELDSRLGPKYVAFPSWARC
jgi:hypothetical protein